MSEVTTIETKVRDSIGTGSARALRLEGFIPAVLYGGEGKPMHLAIDERIITKELNQEGFTSKVLDVKVGSKTEKALARDIQLHPVSDRPLHIDFLRVSKTSVVTVSVPLHFVNEEESPGLKRGAVLNIVQHELSLTCPANSIPESLTLDLTGLDVGDSLHIDALNLPKG
ncbi:MAG: 50S ribosomal protein L25/general stress protein Ctc, partial [bacterium]|nr:50S ribosomal protein L25/general stress protein Ctc [bacterium]